MELRARQQRGKREAFAGGSTHPEGHQENIAALPAQARAAFAAAVANPRPGMGWYAVQVAAGYEKATRSALEERIAAAADDLRECFGMVALPTETVVSMRAGAKRLAESKLYPGYLFLQVAMNTEDAEKASKVWHLVRYTPKVLGFIGGDSTTPRALTEGEIGMIAKQIAEGAESFRPLVMYQTGENVRVKDGPFADFNGTVEDVNYDRNRLTVSVMVFGRVTPVELDFEQVEKI